MEEYTVVLNLKFSFGKEETIQIDRNHPRKSKKIDENAQKSDLVINDISCDAGSGDCLYTPTPNSPCYDNDTSTVNDVCDSEGECSGSSLNCIVGNVCVDGFSTTLVSVTVVMHVLKMINVLMINVNHLMWRVIAHYIWKRILKLC